MLAPVIVGNVIKHVVSSHLCQDLEIDVGCNSSYVSFRTYISAKWEAFDDPQSGLEKYSWRVGTTPGGDNIVSAIDLHLTEIAVLSNSSNYHLDLPVKQKIFITVRAYNKAGLYYKV